MTLLFFKLLRIHFTDFLHIYCSSSRQLMFDDGSHGNTENMAPRLMEQAQAGHQHGNQSLNSSHATNSFANSSHKSAESFEKVCLHYCKIRIGEETTALCQQCVSV